VLYLNILSYCDVTEFMALSEQLTVTLGVSIIEDPHLLRLSVSFVLSAVSHHTPYITHTHTHTHDKLVSHNIVLSHN